MGPSLVELAQEELEEHGVEVDEPSRVDTREDIMATDMVEEFGGGVRAAAYDPATDSITLYEPLAKQGAVQEILTEEEMNLISEEIASGEAPDRLIESVDREFNSLEAVKKQAGHFGRGKIDEQARDIAICKAVYDSLVEGVVPESVEDYGDQLVDEFRRQLQFSAEHELIHKAGLDAFVDVDIHGAERLANLEELAAIEAQSLYNDDPHFQQVKDKKHQIKTQQYPANQLDLLRTGVMAVDEEYEENKRKVREDEEFEHQDLEDYLDRRAEELEEEIQKYNRPLAERMQSMENVPLGSVGESFAHFWNMYRDGSLEDQIRRESKKEGLKENYPEGGSRAAAVIDELFQQYDQAEGTEKERVYSVMAQQPEYLQEEMNRTVADRIKDRVPGTDYLPF